MSDPAELKARVLAMARSTPSMPRREASARVSLVLASSVLVAVAIYFASDGPRNGQGRALWFYASSLLGWLAVASVALWGALARGRSALGRPRPILIAVALATPLVLFAWMLAFALLHPEVTLVHSERIGFKCMALTIAAAALPLAGIAFTRHGSDPVHPVATGAALGAACGAAAGVMVVMWCPVAAPAHVAFGHILPLVVLTAIGALLGQRVIAMSAARLGGGGAGPSAAARARRPHPGSPPLKQ